MYLSDAIARIRQARFTLGECAVAIVAVLIGMEVGIGRLNVPWPHRRSADRVPAIAGLEYKYASATSLIFLRSTCHFCSESLPFYGELATAAARHGVRVVFVSDEPIDIVESYLQSHGIPAPRVVIAPLTDFAIQATPTLIAVNSSGDVIGRWVGLQNADRQIVIERTLGIR